MKILLAVLFSFSMLSSSWAVPVRIKDLVEFEGVRGNDLIGYGLVVGLDGSGDSLRNVPLTEELLVSLMDRLGVNMTAETLRSKNVAAVVVTATLPAFSRAGSRVNVNVSTIGDARSLLGGTLVMTPLKAADGDIYAVAQGSIISGGSAVYGDAARVVEGVPTVGVIPSGARIEREVDFDFSSLDTLRLSLRNGDFTTAARIEAAINDKFGAGAAVMQDSGTVVVNHRLLGDHGIARLASEIENISVYPEAKATVVIDHRSGTVVMNESVRVSRVAISQGGTVVTVSEAPVVFQPNPFSQGETVAAPKTSLSMSREGAGEILDVSDSATLDELIQGLNRLGVRTVDLIDVLKSMHTAGALHAEIIVN